MKNSTTDLDAAIYQSQLAMQAAMSAKVPDWGRIALRIGEARALMRENEHDLALAVLEGRV